MVRPLSIGSGTVVLVDLTETQGIFARRPAHRAKDPEGKYYLRLRERSSRELNSSVLSIKA